MKWQGAARAYLLLALAVTLPASDEIVIHQLTIDGTDYTVPAVGAIRVPALDGHLRIDFSGPVEEGIRLRYRLNGVDTAWQDPPNFMRILINFMDERKEVIGSCDFSMRGETPGWSYVVESSAFVARRESHVVPLGSHFATISILSHGQDDGVGIVGVDHMRFSVTPATGGSSREFPLDTTSGRDMDQLQGSPRYWYRGYGNRAEIAEVRIRQSPKPHPILVLNDGDPQHYGNWALNNRLLPVTAGDSVTLAWEVAHSIGRSGRHVAEYTGLAPGTYLFRAALCTIDGRPTRTVINIPIEVVDPWHQRWYFLVGILTLAAALGAWSGHAFKRRRLMQRLAELERHHALERERERIARDLHDNIGAGLTEIAMLSDWVHDDLQAYADGDTRNRVERISQSAMELARSVDEIVWAINPANDDLRRFANYLMQASSQFLGATTIRVRYQIPQDLEPLPISGKIRHNLFLVIREALNNTIKYAHASLVRIELGLSDHIIRVVVEDDGVGFNAGRSGLAGTHEGLDSMKRRITDIGGVLHLVTHPGQGTRIELQVHVANAKQGRP
jgi:signal transduction histidine kinase